MDGTSQTPERQGATGARRLVLLAAQTFVLFVIVAALLLLLYALLVGVTDVGPSGFVLLGAAAALVFCYGLRLAWPLLIRAARRIAVRFSLRTLLIMTVVCGVCVAWLGNKVRDVREQRRILGQVFEGGFGVGFTDWYSDWMPRWVYRRFGISGPIATGSLDCVVNNATVRDEDLRALAGLRFCELSLNFSNVTDDQIVGGPLPANLKCFAAQGTALGDRALEHIAGCQSLEAVELHGTSVTDAGVAHLVRLPNLYMLGLEKTPLTDDAVEHLKKMKQLRVLRVWQTSITPQRMDELRKALPECLIVDDFRKATKETYFYWPEKR